MSEGWKDAVKSGRQTIIRGRFMDLIPVRESDLSDIVELRNRERNKYFLCQENDITLEQQKQWYETYCNRENDIYWGIHNKGGDLIGTIRLYDIRDDYCEEGSCIIDEDCAKDAPYMAEAKYITTCFAFDSLGVKKIKNHNRKDNKVMNSLSRQLGYEKKGIDMLRGTEYIEFFLTPEQFPKEKISRLLDYWTAR